MFFALFMLTPWWRNIQNCWHNYYKLAVTTAVARAWELHSNKDNQAGNMEA
jgi:hypothetical protein